jgi:hypothetical protein
MNTIKHDDIVRNKQDVYVIVLGQDETLSFIFNNLQTSGSVPFAYCHVRDEAGRGQMRNTKMFERLSTEMLRSHRSENTSEFVAPNTIECIVLGTNKYTKDVNDYKKYTNATLSIDSAQLRIVFAESRPSALENLMNALPAFARSSVSRETVMAKKTDVIYYNFSIEPSEFYILADIIMGNADAEERFEFSKKFVIDESVKSVTMKDFTFVNYIFSSARLLRFRITSKTNDDLEFPFKDEMTYTIVSFEFMDDMTEEMLSQFVNDLDSLFTVYNSSKSKIALEYQMSLGESVIKKTEFETSVYKRLSPVEYNILKASAVIKNPYSRVCSKERTPQIVEEYDREKFRLDDPSMGVFPAQKNAKDPFEQVVVDCSKNKTYNFYGTVRNYEKNEYFKQVPCCFKKPKGEVERDSKQQLFFKTDRSVSLAKNVPELGVLVEEPNSFFNWLVKSKLTKSVDVNPMSKSGMEFVRIGVPDGPNSFLQCVHAALNRKFYTDIEVKTIRELYSQRMDTLNLCRQEMNSLSTTEISAVLKDQDAYIDPMKFVHLLEWENNCKIYLFSRNGIEIPSSSSVCLSTLKSRPMSVVLVYVRDDEEHCELIGLYNGGFGELSDKTNFVKARESYDMFKVNFEYGGVVDTEIRAAVDLTVSNFVFGQRSVFDDSKNQLIRREIVFNDVFKVYPDFQMIDLKGFTRTLVFRVVVDSRVLGLDIGNYVVVMNLFSPIQPIHVPTIGDVAELDGTMFPTRNEVNAILSQLIMRDTASMVEIASPNEISRVVYETDTISFWIDTKTVLGRSSELSDFVYKQRLQTYVLEYFVWYFVQTTVSERERTDVLFGTYEGERTENAVIDAIDKFMKRHVVVVDESEMAISSLPAMTFSTSNPMFVETVDGNSKIKVDRAIVSSLVFNLRLKLRNARIGVFETYLNRTSIPDYYAKTEYFDKRESEAVFETTESNLRSAFARSEIMTTRDLKSGNFPILKVPYFFSNDDKLFLADNCDCNVVQGVSAIVKIYTWNLVENRYYNPSVPVKKESIADMLTPLNIPMRYVEDVLPRHFRRYEKIGNERSKVDSTENYIVDFNDAKKRVVNLFGDYKHVRRCDICFSEFGENQQMCCI